MEGGEREKERERERERRENERKRERERRALLLLLWYQSPFQFHIVTLAERITVLEKALKKK